MDQSRTPYFQALLDYVDSGVLPFHTPGHIQGIGMDLAFREFIGDNICAIDLTPMPGIDDLLQPTESIKEAQALAAEAWGADHTFFLINGSTSGNQCMMMTAVNPGDEDRGAAQLAQVDARRAGDERRAADLHAARGRRRAAHGSLRHARNGRAHAGRASGSRRRSISSRQRTTASPPTWPRSSASSTMPASCCSSTRPGGRTFTFIPRLPLSATQPARICASTRPTKCSRPFRSARCCIKRATASGSTGSRRSSRCFSRPRRICRWSPRSTSPASRWRPKATRCCRARSSWPRRRAAGSIGSTGCTVSARKCTAAKACSTSIRRRSR